MKAPDGSESETHQVFSAPSPRLSNGAGQESIEYQSAQNLSGDNVLPWLSNTGVAVDKIEQTRSSPAIDPRSRNEFEQRGLGLHTIEDGSNSI